MLQPSPLRPSGNWLWRESKGTACSWRGAQGSQHFGGSHAQQGAPGCHSAPCREGRAATCPGERQGLWHRVGSGRDVGVVRRDTWAWVRAVMAKVRREWGQGCRAGTVWPRTTLLSFLFPFCQLHSNSTLGRNDFLSFWGDGSLLKNVLKQILFWSMGKLQR